MPSALYHQALEGAKRHHASSKTYSGKLMRPHAGYIKTIIDRLGCESVLDYGCGKGAQYLWVASGPKSSIPDGMTIEEFWAVPVTKYDPAYPPFAARPGGQFDLVICTHTLGCIPVEDHSAVVADLYSLARKAVYVAEQVTERRSKEDPALHPAGRGRAYWESVLRAVPHTVEVTLSTRERTGRGAVTTRGVV